MSEISTSTVTTLTHHQKIMNNNNNNNPTSTTLNNLNSNNGNMNKNSKKNDKDDTDIVINNNKKSTTTTVTIPNISTSKTSSTIPTTTSSTTNNSTSKTTSTISSSNSQNNQNNKSKTSTNTTTTEQQQQQQQQKQHKMIQILPQSVVDKIAAGEVVQRASSAIKELCENSLDAKSTHIHVQYINSTNFTIIDNGYGINKNDLLLACTRHATSKITSINDLYTNLISFGFRGEALASISMVSKIKIISKTINSIVAYQMQYQNGKPINQNPTPIARAGIHGTTVIINDLFYNLPHRIRNNNNADRDEYQYILRIMQLYAIHYAKNGVTIQCTYKNKTDLNTAATIAAINKTKAASSKNSTNKNNDKDDDDDDDATKNVIAHVFGSHLLPHLLKHTTSLYKNDEEKNSSKKDLLEEKKDDAEGNNSSDSNDLSNNDNGNNEIIKNDKNLIYSCQGYITSPSASSVQGGSSSSTNNKFMKRSGNNLILFINNRLIDGCTTIRKAIENVYVDFCKSKPPLIYLSIQVPCTNIDVNVHPTKRDVTLLHMDIICQHIAQSIQQTLFKYGTQTFITNSVRNNDSNNNNNNENNNKKKTLQQKQLQLKRKSLEEEDEQQQQTSSTTTKKRTVKTMIRTNRGSQVGAMEPFVLLSSQQSQQSLSQSSQNSTTPTTTLNNMNDSEFQHLPDCPLRQTSSSSSSSSDNGNNNNDDPLSIPGAFATAAAHCTCKSVRLPPMQQQRKFRKLPPTPCVYTSIKKLRQRVEKHCDMKLQKKLRISCYVGTASHDRSLIQSGEDLLLMDHYQCAYELFYQLALNGFKGGCGIATLGTTDNDNNKNNNVIDIQNLIGQYLQIEDLVRDSTTTSTSSSNEENNNNNAKLPMPLLVSETNQMISEQATTCLLQHADMLLEYFSISIKKINKKVCIVGLPVLLEGYEPSPHGLPLFLFRLATEVNWTEEKLCFHGICRELGLYYAQLPSLESSEYHSAFVQHTLFPAISSMLVVSEQIWKQNFVSLTALPKLYRVFERC